MISFDIFMFFEEYSDKIEDYIFINVECSNKYNLMPLVLVILCNW